MGTLSLQTSKVPTKFLYAPTTFKVTHLLWMVTIMVHPDFITRCTRCLLMLVLSLVMSEHIACTDICNEQSCCEKLVGTFGDENVERKCCMHDFTLMSLTSARPISALEPCQIDVIWAVFTFYVLVTKGF